MIVCAFPDLASRIAFYLREWPLIFTLVFFALTLFHRQWVIFFLAKWASLGNLIAAAFARLSDKEIQDPYCQGYYWRPFPSVVCFSVGTIVGFSVAYSIVYQRRPRLFLTVYCLALASAVPALSVSLGVTRAWQSIVSVLLGMVWGGIYAGAVFLGGELMWSAAKESPIFRYMGFKTDDWSSPSSESDTDPDKAHRI